MTRPAIRSWALLLAALLPATPAAARQEQPLVVRASVTPCLVVRVHPAVHAAPVTCLPPGTTVTGIGSAPYWRRIRLADGRTGWSAKKFLEVPGGAAPDPAASAPAVPDRDDAWLEIHVVDVVQGDGIWIHTFDDGIPGNGRWEGRNIVIDGGPRSSDATNPFLPYLRDRAHPGAVIDALIVTHPHNDHFPGASGLLRHFEVCAYYDPGIPKDLAQYATFRAAVDAERCGGSPVAQHVGRSQFGSPDWGGELRVEFLWAWPGDNAGLGSGSTLENNASIVLKLTYGTESILLMGDAEGKDRDDPPGTSRYAEARLLAEAGAARLRSTVLKIAHHGSETSSTIPFIQAVDPRFLVVSSGRKPYNGRFLPDATTLARYCAHNPAIRIFRTDQDDAAEGLTGSNDFDGDHVVIRMNGKTTVVEALSSGHPFQPTSCAP